MALVIAISHGAEMCDPYSCSAKFTGNSGLTLGNPIACRNWIAKEKGIPKRSIDEVLVIENDEVIHHHGGQDGF